MRIFFCFLISQLLNLSSFAQNLVVNPSFEQGAKCDGSTEKIDTVVGWSPIAGTPTYINTNCPLSKNSRSFVQGMKLPPAAHRDVLTLLKFDITGEFQQGRLISALEKDKQYIVKMFVRLPIKFCSTAIKEIGVVLSEDLLEVSTEKRKIDIPALALQNNDQTFIKKQYDWQEVSAVYKANGGEKYIAIGNFSNINEDAFNNRQENECTYIFIDLVSVSEFKEIQLPSFSIDMSLKKGERILLTEVTFEEGSNVLKESSFEILNDVMKILKENPKMKIEISSHSDNSLDGMKSLTFTKARAEKIIEHLTNKGALETQLIGVGRGSTNAIALNNSVNGRKKNDRIEMRILEL